ncbi:agmatinase [Cuniculiplasma divulgatum]|uniref:Agmatinase n=1 Tax=Cuniculiplasma divulgatum TaxID=1673428 RepID=A0A1R4A8F7_9ARCH|nr:agmatinase [Cuniculiplasma divulgatum]
MASLKRIADATFDYEDAHYVIFGVPFDYTSSFRRGSSRGPIEVRRAYDNLESFDVNYEVDFSELPICDIGDIQVNEDASETVDLVEEVTSIITRDGKIPIMIGGEHSITGGSIRNFKDASMVIIDAHSDFRDSYMGNKHNHACVTHRALDVLGEGRIFSFGTRSTSREEFEDPDYHKVRFVSADEIRKEGIDRSLSKIEGKLRDKVYFSIDMDGIDPSFAPGVGTPEPFGLNDVDVRYLIRTLARKIYGFDVLEFTPDFDNGNTSMLAAKLIQDFIGSRETKKQFF